MRTGNKVRWLLAGYVVLLLLCLPISYLIPTEHGEYVQADELEKIVQEWNNFYLAVTEGKLAKIDNSLLQKKQEWDYSAQQLKLNVENNDYLDLWIVVERKETDDAKLEVVTYKSRSAISEGDFMIDFTDKLQPIGITLSDNTLSLRKPEPVILEFAQFKKEFTISQFKEEENWTKQHSSSFLGQQLLYLQIPRNLELINETNLDIHYVGE